MDFADEKKRRTAFHEAGHAWMMVKEGLGVKTISLRARKPVQGDNRGETIPLQPMEVGQKDLLKKHAKAALAGSAAEQYLLGSWDEEGLTANAYDIDRARSCLNMMDDDWIPDALDHHIQSLADTVMDEITRPKAWDSITGLAYALLETGTLDGDMVLDIIGEGTGT